MKTKEPKIKKEKKQKLEIKFCCICGDNTSDYIIYLNGYICKKCQEGSQFKKIQEKKE